MAADEAIQKALQRRKVPPEGAQAHPLRADKVLENALPAGGAALRQHGAQRGARQFVAIKVALVETVAPGGWLTTTSSLGLHKAAHVLKELKLKDVRGKVADVLDAGGYVVLGARVKVSLGAFDGRRETLVTEPQRPPVPIEGVVEAALRGKDVPAPAVEDVGKREKDDLLEGHLQLVVEVDLLSQLFI